MQDAFRMHRNDMQTEAANRKSTFPTRQCHKPTPRKTLIDAHFCMLVGKLFLDSNLIQWITYILWREHFSTPPRSSRLSSRFMFIIQFQTHIHCIMLYADKNMQTWHTVLVIYQFLLLHWFDIFSDVLTMYSHAAIDIKIQTKSGRFYDR